MVLRFLDLPSNCTTRSAIYLWVSRQRTLVLHIVDIVQMLQMLQMLHMAERPQMLHMAEMLQKIQTVTISAGGKSHALHWNRRSRLLILRFRFKNQNFMKFDADYPIRCGMT